MKPFYSGKPLYWTHLCNGLFLRNGWNDDQTFTAKSLRSGHFIADIIFKYQYISPPRNDLSIADTPNNRTYKKFLIRLLYTFYFRQFLQFHLIFLRSLSFYFLTSLMALSIKNQISRDFQSVFASMIDAFLSCKDIQSVIGQG